MAQLTEAENGELSKVLTHELVHQVTKSMHEVGAVDFERRMKRVFLDLLEKPLQKLVLQEELLQKYGDTTRKNVRRVHELEYTLQQY